jgi:hypothetical protein
MRQHMEEYYGLTLEEILPVGRELEIIKLPDRPVATGFAEGMFEIPISEIVEPRFPD